MFTTTFLFCNLSNISQIKMEYHMYIETIDIILFLCSTLKKSIIEEHSLTFLKQHSSIYGDVEWKEFTDPILTEHVDSIAVVDTDLIERETQVCLFWRIKNVACGEK